MGFFSDLWDSVKNTASNIWSGAKSVASTVYDTVKKPIEWVANAGDVVSKIPVIGTLAQPVIAAAKGAKSILDQGKAVADVVKTIGLKTGGVISQRMFQKQS